MAALTADKEVIEREGVLVDHPVVASDIIFKGALVKINAAGFVAPCAAEAGAKFAGVSDEFADNSSGSAGDIAVNIKKRGLFHLLIAGLTQADVGSAVYATDDQLVTLTFAANLQKVGVIDEFVSATEAVVRIEVDADEGGAAVAALGAPSATYVEAEQILQSAAIDAILVILKEHKLMQG